MIEELELKYFELFGEFPMVFNWEKVEEKDKIDILKECIKEKVEVYESKLYTTNYLETSE